MKCCKCATNSAIIKPMPIITPFEKNPAVDGRQPDMAMDIRRCVLAGLREDPLVFIPEFTLPGGRRADLIGLDEKGLITIIEIKSSVADYNSDSKWHEYWDYCDRFYFASHPDVPGDIFPDHEGFILADSHGCEILRQSETRKLAGPTRKALTLKIARNAVRRLQTISDYAASKDI